VVFSTATQPAFECIESFRGIRAREIVPQHAEHFERLKRVDFEWRVDEPASWDGLADDMAAHPRALAILNTKKHALALVDALEARAPGVVHLSTLLCGAHRRRVLAEVRRRLLAGEECRLVSTQVVEAGVDISFPLVYRALGPLDAIIQAAGRCNRAGEMERGNVVVFRPEDDGMPQGVYRTGTGVTRSLRHTAEFDPLTDATAREYFRQLFALVEPDADGIQEMRRRLDYPAVDAAFRMIDDDTEQVIVTQYGTQDERARVVERLEQLRRKRGSPRLILRELQPYMVSLRKREAERLRKDGFISEIMPGLGEWLGDYDETRGLVVGDPEYVV
jgi:CRISPR-associated endonuclease/helicase Cas3